MNVMPIISVAIFVLLAGGATLLYRWLRRDSEDCDGVYGINESGESRPSDQGDIVGKV